jgi:hypothetical protein
MRASAVVLASVMLLAVTACPSDPYDPQTWIKKLDDPAEAATALQKLQQLKDPVAIPSLGAFWRKHNYPSKVLRTIIELADRVDVDGKTGQVKLGPTYGPAVPFLIEAIDNFDIGDQQSIDDASVAADALGRAIQAGENDEEITATLVNTAKKIMPKLSPGQRVRIAATRALGYMKNSPRATDTLIEILGTDLKKQPISLNAAAANALAEAASTRAIQPLLKAVFELPPIYQQCRTALAAIGEPVIPELIKIFEGKHADLEQYAKENNFANNCSAGRGPSTTCRAPGALRFKAAALLGDLRARHAVPMLTGALKSEPLPSFFDPQTGAPGPSTHNAVLDALRNIGDAKAADAVYAYLQAAGTSAEIKPMAMDVYSMLAVDRKALAYLSKIFLDDAADEQLRLAASLAYGRLAAQKSDLAPVEEMINRYKKPADKNQADAEKQAKLAEAEEKAGKELEAQALADSNKSKAGALKKKADAHFSKAEDYRDQQAQLEDTSKGYRGYQRGFEETKMRAEVGIACGSDAACFAKYLDGDDIKTGSDGLPRAERALISIGKLGSKAEALLDTLLKHAHSTERIVRQGILLALPQIAKLPCDSCEKRLYEVIESQKDQTTLDYLTADTRITMYYFRWAGRGGGKGQ